MDTMTLNQGTAAYPRIIQKRMHKPPSALFVRGTPLSGLLSKKRVAIVGSRHMTAYGKQVTQQFATALARQGIVIVSGLAHGVDACAHQATLDAGGVALAVLPSPVEDPVPYANQALARRIIDSGGALVSSYPAGSVNHKANFVARNELVAAVSDIVLVTEGTTDSGSRHTIMFASDMPGVQPMAVPGNIDQPSSAGPNTWIASEKAKLAFNPQDIIKELGLTTNLELPLYHSDDPHEQRLLDLVSAGVSEGHLLLERSELPVHIYNQALTMLEINGLLKPLGGDHWGLA